MPGEVKAQRLALGQQALLGRPLCALRIRLGVDLLGREQIEQPRLTALAIALAALPLLDRAVDRGHQRRASPALRDRVERAGMDQALERALVDALEISPPAQL